MAPTILAISALLLSLSLSALLLTAARVLLSYSTHRGTTIPLVAGQEVGDGDALVGMPDSILAFIDEESEEWARDEVRGEAAQLHKILRDWEKVEVELRKRYTRFSMSSQRAADIAWGSAVEGAGLKKQDNHFDEHEAL